LIQLLLASIVVLSGMLRLPVELYTTGGTPLDRGVYTLELRPSGLVFMQGNDLKTTITRAQQNPVGSSDDVTLFLGTQYLGSSAEPVLTSEERRHSKTGKALYEEEARDWSATLRAYKIAAKGQVIFEVTSRKEKSVNVSYFQLSLRPLSSK